MMGEARRNFIGYEYKEIAGDGKNVSLLLDGYESFGWTAEEKSRQGYGGQDSTIRLKRDRKIPNKAELTRLERHFEDCIRQIGELERRKTSSATAAALIVGGIGTAFMAGSVFAVTAEPPLIWLCILLALPAFAGWILPFFLYQKIAAGKTAALAPLIDGKYEEIYEICEKGSQLL